MATKRVDTSGLRNLVNEYLNEFGLEAYDALEEASAQVGKEIVKELRKGGGYNTDSVGEKFNKGWTAEQQVSRASRMKVLIAPTIVYNKNVPGLAHLLEFGHAKRNGGRTRAFNFIAPVADSVEQKFESAFEKALNK